MLGILWFISMYVRYLHGTKFNIYIVNLLESIREIYGMYVIDCGRRIDEKMHIFSDKKCRIFHIITD